MAEVEGIDNQFSLCYSALCSLMKRDQFVLDSPWLTPPLNSGEISLIRVAQKAF